MAIKKLKKIRIIDNTQDLAYFINAKGIRLLFVYPVTENFGFAHYEVIYEEE